MSTLKVNTINAATSGQAVAVDVKNPRSFRNLIINGAMNVAQRGTSSTTTSDYTCDRFRVSWSGADEALTHSQHTLTSSDTGPWEKGFRKSLHITNGNQTGGADAGDSSSWNYRVEGQDIVNSGWISTDSDSKITLSFWVKSSVAQNFYALIYTDDSPNYAYVIETGSLTADTWTKIEKTIPGNSNLAIANDNGNGLEIDFQFFRGTTTTGTVTLNQWAAFNSSARTPNQTSTWWTTNDATIEFTGVQLEVGSYATDFEHRSYGDELARCQRYCYKVADGAAVTLGTGVMYTSSVMQGMIQYPVTMRTTPTISATTGTNYYEFIRDGGTDWFNELLIDNRTSPHIAEITNDSQVSGTVGHGGYIRTDNSAVKVIFNAEL